MHQLIFPYNVGQQNLLGKFVIPRHVFWARIPSCGIPSWPSSSCLTSFFVAGEVTQRNPSSFKPASFMYAARKYYRFSLLQWRLVCPSLDYLCTHWRMCSIRLNAARACFCMCVYDFCYHWVYDINSMFKTCCGHLEWPWPHSIFIPSVLVFFFPGFEAPDIILSPGTSQDPGQLTARHSRHACSTASSSFWANYYCCCQGAS